jgi:hypothetical protein
MVSTEALYEGTVLSGGGLIMSYCHLDGTPFNSDLYAYISVSAGKPLDGRLSE